MSATVGAFEAKTHLAALLERVAKGERITITKHGVPTAVLVPVEGRQTAAPKMGYAETVEGLRKLRKSVKKDKMSVRDLVEEGRRR